MVKEVALPFSTLKFCSGCGFLKSVPSISFQILRTIKEEIRSKGLTEALLLMVSPKVFDYLIHQEYQSILQLEKNLNCKIMVESNDAFDDAQHTIKKM